MEEYIKDEGGTFENESYNESLPLPEDPKEFRPYHFKWRTFLKTRYKDMDASEYVNNATLITLFEGGIGFWGR